MVQNNSPPSVILFKSLFPQWKSIDKGGYLFLHVHYNTHVKTSTISFNVMDPNKSYNFVVAKDSGLEL